MTTATTEPAEAGFAHTPSGTDTEAKVTIGAGGKAVDTARATGQLQLSFDVGGQRPSSVKVSIGGKIHIDRQLRKGDRVVVHVLDDNGELVCDAPGTVTAIAFVDKTDSDGFVTTTREQKITLDA